MNHSPWGFSAGLVVGSLLTLAALTMATDISPSNVALGEAVSPQSGAQHSELWAWLVANLGHSFWFFALVLVLYLMNLVQLDRLLKASAAPKRLVELDQLSDVWIHLFVGIGVIWTAVGMRSALQVALADPGGALADTADSVLRKLVDGGILLALSTTIVGGIGGYLMRLLKTLWVGARLHALFEADHRSDLRELVGMAQRIEAGLQANAELAGERTVENAAQGANLSPQPAQPAQPPQPPGGTPLNHAPAL